MNIIKTTPVVPKFPISMTNGKQHKFNSLKKKLINFEQKRFSRIKDELSKVKDNFTEDINEIDKIMKETFKNDDEDEEQIISTYDIEKKNDSFFD